MNAETIMLLLPLIAGWIADLSLGDPERMPHPVVLFGKMIAKGERALNKGGWRMAKGACLSVGLTAAVYIITCSLLNWLEHQGRTGIITSIILSTYIVFTCLAGTTLIREVRMVFQALERSLDDGRRQVARIVGRDTSALSAQEVRTAALETLAENLSDGVIAPLFWFVLLGPQGMLAYKMVNTLDSMIGYKTDRYIRFGRFAARIDDMANIVPARLTALLMLMAAALMRMGGGLLGRKTLPCERSLADMARFTLRYCHAHTSPNSGWPEAALASLLDCRFGGGHNYFGQYFDKPFIGDNPRALNADDMRVATRINRLAEIIMVIVSAACIVLKVLATT